jgi:hypothetical protein
MAFFGRPCVVMAAGALCAAALSVTAAASQESKSAAVAKELVLALDAAKATDIAAPDPLNPGGFIAALYIPGTQLLVVSAKYSAPPLMVDRINARDFMGVYVDLQSASVRGTKVFIQDQGADGLSARSDGDGPADTWDEGDKSVAFDGDWKKAKVASEADYAKSYTDADDRYAKMLAALLAQVKQMKAKAGS